MLTNDINEYPSNTPKYDTIRGHPRSLLRTFRHDD